MSLKTLTIAGNTVDKNLRNLTGVIQEIDMLVGVSSDISVDTVEDL